MSLFLSESILSKRKNSRHLTGIHISLWKLSSGTLTLFYSFYIQKTLLWIQKVPETQNVCKHRNPDGKKSADIQNQVSGPDTKTDWNVLITSTKHYALHFCSHASRTKHWNYNFYHAFVYWTLISHLNYVPTTYVSFKYYYCSTRF